MKKQKSTHARVAALIRADLKAAGIKGRVRSRATAVTIDLEGALPGVAKAVEAATAQYQYGHFNGMEDIYEYSNTRDDIPQVQFLFVYNTHSDETRQAAWDHVRATWAGLEDAPADVNEAHTFRFYHEWADQFLRRQMADPRFDFWRQFKPRTTATAGTDRGRPSLKVVK